MENKDSICYINRISNITRIRQADRIELATVNGWTSIVAKDTHKIGDLVLCIVTDGVIPDHLAEKWGVKQYLRKGNRVRTIKLKEVYSEAILIPAFDIPYSGKVVDFFEGQDMMSQLGIFKYEEPENLHTGLGKGQPRSSKNRHNQNFNKYHKFPNFKNVPNIFNEEDEVVITRKIHGSNARYGILKKNRVSLWHKLLKFFGKKDLKFDYEFVYGSHNVQKINDEPGYYKTDIWAKINEKHQLEEKLWSLAKRLDLNSDLDTGLVLFGEIYGPGIQGDKYSYDLTEIDFAAFDIELNGNYVSRVDFELMCPTVTTPVLYKGKWSEAVQQQHVLNQYIGDSKVPHEGVVVACHTGDRQKVAKVINPEYHTYGEKHHVPDGH